MKPSSIIRRLAVCLAGTALAAASLTVVTTNANAADYQFHCIGFSKCKTAGLSTYGYESVYQQSFWRATPGHNCTNYVAYRLSHNGRLVYRPSNLGNASEWGINAEKEGIHVYSSPKVGDVAWWSYHRGSSTRSHVKMVERVNGDGSITVSEDNLTGDFDWRTISRGSPYPSGFLRFPQSDGSPRGFLKTVTNQDGKVTVFAYGDEPGSPDRASIMIVSWGGPRGAKGTIKQTSTRPLIGSWYAYRTFAAGKLPKVVYVYALNTKGTKGSDFFYGKLTIK
ncbi:MAG: CHAP domain-containing protein [Actinomycetota bacterium]|nr:CHAP domain-containing protein [Actinomycetota bacterium]